MLPVDQRVFLIVGLTVAVIVVVIVARVLTGRKWRNRLPFIDEPRNQKDPSVQVFDLEPVKP